ncbi:MAG TPA: hypothetical protein VLG27_05135, partial [Candidatus Saccharimonadia bacterium]|nr:hypothetical protein [Candidatus Saccharimonadia bacterium]
SYPFFITDQTKDANTSGGGTVLLTLNSQTRTLGVKLTSQFKESSTSFSFNADLTFTPTNDVAKISAPTGAVPLSQLLSQLGYADLLSSLQSSASSGSITGNANDSKRQADINSLQTQLEAYFQQSGNYPSLGDMNDDSWLTQNMPDLDRSALQDPDGPNDGLVATLAAKAYAYQPTDDSGNSCEADDTQCSKYTLTATLSDGTTYQKANLD